MKQARPHEGERGGRREEGTGEVARARSSSSGLGALEDEVGDELDEAVLGRAHAGLAQVELDLLDALPNDPLTVEEELIVAELGVLGNRVDGLLGLQLVVLGDDFLDKMKWMR